MACGTCCALSNRGTTSDPRWRKALWIALGVNAVMFAAEIVAGIAGGSRALQADALDFLGDSANYAISLGVAGVAIAWRSRAALLKGATLTGVGFYVLAAALWAAWRGSAPIAPVMGLVGTLALLANGAVAIMLYRFRTGDANMRSVWICSRNDAIGNVAVILAALGVFGTGSALPDILVALVMASLGIWGGLQITRQALGEIRPSVERPSQREAGQSPPNPVGGHRA